MAGPCESRGSSGSSTARIPFIVSLNVEKADPATRKLIRSHGRRGKNNKGAAKVKLEEVMEMYTPLVVGHVGTDLSFVQFADEIEPSILLNITKGSNGYPIGRNAAALHITAFAVGRFIDRILRRQEISINSSAMLYFRNGLRLLRERLLGEDDEIKVSDSTIRDHQTSKQRMEGLRKMVDLRGGLDVFKGRELLIEVLRCGLGIAPLNGSNPVCFFQPSEPVIEYPEKLLLASDDKMCSQDNIELIRNMDHDLATAWLVMRRFCLLVNLGTQTQWLIRPEIIHETMTAVIYRLLHMGFAAGSIGKTVRHGLLAFSHHVFLQWQEIKLPYHHFPTSYQNCILGLKLVDGVKTRKEMQDMLKSLI
ncbi:hypothetical protein V1517DRAFT_332366 [Lipomyces orientalis]|uniref:Uncharacterized protein n=1 Tax=Lipomyces orientalis TaxID=1233043 RepID=A0ACC3TEW8_9ASCO